ncbi:MAG: hypothetical protein CSA84_01650 [Actinomycetales bacterium]|nr:MAG: hypothetical protein CSA84_01650 [Actinomycetales bacterium]
MASLRVLSVVSVPRPQLRVAALLCAVFALAACGSTATGSDSDEPTSALSHGTVSTGSVTMPSTVAPSTAAPDGTTDPVATTDTTAQPVAGRYTDYTDYENSTATAHEGTVVLFFHAEWCHACRDADEALTKSGVPDGITVVKVDYDDRVDLRQKYGVTQQHTFVQIDEQGESIKKWTGSTDGADVAAATV